MWLSTDGACPLWTYLALMDSQPAPICDVAEKADPSSPDLSGMRRVLVGFDERPASRDALALGRALCERTGAELIVASVRPYWPELIGPDKYARAVAADEAWLGREASKALGEQPFRTSVIAGGHETSGLKEIAAGESADVIVVGSTHRGRLGQVLPGSVGERVLNNAPCAVAVAPLGLAGKGLRLEKVAVAYDGSREAGVALDLALELAQPAGATLLILGAVEFNVEVTGLGAQTLDDVEVARMQHHLERARERVPASVEVETRILRGPPSHVISEAAECADLLVLGSRGHYGAARRVLLGSVATQVTRSAPCATLVTPAA
jgi:nucleotide-binding universal stress UspA family protein